MKRWTRWAALLAAGVAISMAWRVQADRVADRFFSDDDRVVVPLADAVAAAVLPGVTADDFMTGDDRFNGEWALVTCQMAILGLGQVVQQRPHLRERYRPAIRGCGRWLTTPQARAFGTAAWGLDGLEDSDLQHGHAYLGWLNAALGMAARVDGDPDVVATHERLTASLAARLASLPVHGFETYPGETYPPDLAAVAGSVGLHGGYEHVLAEWEPRYRATALDPTTGLLRQSLSPATGGVADGPRGSGTAIAAYFLGFASPDLSRELASAARDTLPFGCAGFGGVREVPRGAPPRMDIDSGPVIAGVSVSATGFGLASSRIAGDRAWHRRLYRTTHLFGAPTGCSQRWFWTGGSLGNAILLAMLTAERS